jgi:hypothetical protein
MRKYLLLIFNLIIIVIGLVLLLPKEKKVVAKENTRRSIKDTIKTRILKGVKIVEGKWGIKPGEFGIKWESGGLPGGPYPDPAIDEKSNIYVGDILNNRIQKFSNKGEYLLSFGADSGEGSLIGGIGGIVVDQNGFVYVKWGKLIKVYNESGNYVKSIQLDTAIKHPLLWGIDENGNFLISDMSMGHLVSSDGEIIRSHKKNFIPLGEKDYYFKHNKRNKILQLVTVKGKATSELIVKTATNIGRRESFPLWISPEGCFIIMAPGSGSSYKNKIILYINQEGEIVREYIIPNAWSPILGLDGNFYDAGYAQEENNPSYGGFWVKKYVLPQEDRSR